MWIFEEPKAESQESIVKLMRNNKPRHRSSIKEVCGFGLGCLLGGLIGVSAGLLSRNETVIVCSYCIGFVGGGFLGAFVTRRLTK
jgi:uncharacterized protein YcfJ